jgi:hypothetical protein
LGDSLDYTGTFIIMSITVVVNVKIFISTHTHTFWSLLWQVGSIINFFIIFTILNY